MKPYYEDASVQIYLGDCREILPTLAPVDLVLTDPPYGIGIAQNPFRQKFERQTWGDCPVDNGLLFTDYGHGKRLCSLGRELF